MDKIYALFFSQDGCGSKATFLTSISEEESKKYGMERVGKGFFLVGIADANEGSKWLDMDSRVFFIDCWSQHIVCKDWPVFDFRGW